MSTRTGMSRACAGDPSGAHLPALHIKGGQHESAETTPWAESSVNASCTRSGHGDVGTEKLLRLARCSPPAELWLVPIREASIWRTKLVGARSRIFPKVW